MVEEQRQRVEQEMTKMIDELDRSYLRKMQVKMHQCAAACCEDQNGSIERVQQCVQRCSAPLNNAQDYVQQEIEHTQSRLKRCVMQCNDEIKDRMGPAPSERDAQKYSDMFEKCAVKCVDKHIELLPTVLKAMKTVLAKGAPNS
ncbi:uncharacterized protein CBL_08183 [Carabus blaptoides fortunei]